MKRIIIALLSFCTMFCQAQTTATNMLASNGLAIDTVPGNGSETWTIKLPGFKKTVAVQLDGTKISGTVGGTIVMLGSLTGVKYDTVATTSAFTATDVASQTKIFTFENSKYLYYQVKWTGTGTMSASARCYIVARE